jgi:hypothetical protein
MPSPQTLEQLNKFSPRCLVCGSLATWELNDINGVKLTCGPLTQVLYYPSVDEFDIPSEIHGELISTIVDRWLSDLRSNNELDQFIGPVEVSYQFGLKEVYYCDTHMKGGYSEGAHSTPLAGIIRSMDQGHSDDEVVVERVSRYRRPLVI